MGNLFLGRCLRRDGDSTYLKSFHAIRQGIRRAGFSAFTLAELIVVVTILAILASVGFVVLSGYLSDAKESASKTNVRSVYSAISAESASSWNSPRYYVVHDPAYALTGSAIIAFWTNAAALVPGNWSDPGTNYSAGHPDWLKLKLNPEKFRISGGWGNVGDYVSAAEDNSIVLVWAADVMESSGKTRPRSFLQSAGVLSDDTAFVVGNYPTSISGSVSGLIKDVSDPSSTGALVDGGKTGSVPWCPASVMSGYSVPSLSNGQSLSVSKSVSNWSVSGTFSCSFGTVSLVSETPVCDSWYVPSGLSCVADVCGSTVPANASSTATSQAVSGTWHYSATAGQCTFACLANHSWDGNACRASCLVPSSETYSGQTYAISPNGPIVHGTSSSSVGAASFGIFPANGTLSSTFAYSCSDGTLSKIVTPWTGACQTNYAWNSSWSSPACSANSRTATCWGSVPANASATTAATYSQTWNGSAWAPTYSWTNAASICGFSCSSGYAWNGSSCVANAWSSGAWGTCSDETGSWSYGAWWSCSVSCGGGTQTRTAACARNSNGTQTRAVQCLRYDGAVLADANCLAAKPGVSQSCTQGTDAVCGGATLSQACNTQSCVSDWTAWIGKTCNVSWSVSWVIRINSANTFQAYVPTNSSLNMTYGVQNSVSPTIFGSYDNAYSTNRIYLGAYIAYWDTISRIDTTSVIWWRAHGTYRNYLAGTWYSSPGDTSVTIGKTTGQFNVSGPLNGFFPNPASCILN